MLHVEHESEVSTKKKKGKSSACRHLEEGGGIAKKHGQAPGNMKEIWSELGAKFIDYYRIAKCSQFALMGVCVCMRAL